MHKKCIISQLLGLQDDHRGRHQPRDVPDRGPAPERVRGHLRPKDEELSRRGVPPGTGRRHHRNSR